MFLFDFSNVERSIHMIYASVSISSWMLRASCIFEFIIIYLEYNIMLISSVKI